MTLEQLLSQIKLSPKEVEFSDVIAVIERAYDYQATQFHNGLDSDKLTNDAGTNEGSCKIFAFAKDQGLNKDATLACFGKYYREDVLEHPNNTDHMNIRTFMTYGWDGIEFEKEALERK